jgi:myo-inositol catabolism protein IolC
MSLGFDGDLYILACDHRGSFQKKMFGIGSTPNAEERARITAAKAAIFEGLRTALARGTLPKGAGILIDEEFGGEIARQAKALGVVLAMPCEKSGQDEFDFDFGDEFGAHIERFDPSFSKVLVRYNPAGDTGMNQRQTVRLKRLGEWLHARNRKFLFELLVPATKDQLATVGGDEDRYDREVRPGLVMQTIERLQNDGVEPDVWKIEGLDDRANCQRVAETARRGGRDKVICVVLGRGASRERVEHWLRAGSGVPGYRGFAIGRTIWWDAVAGFKDGKLDSSAAAQIIANNYQRAIDVYRGTAK